jgi:hypothetical protein
LDSIQRLQKTIRNKPKSLFYWDILYSKYNLPLLRIGTFNLRCLHDWILLVNYCIGVRDKLFHQGTFLPRWSPSSTADLSLQTADFSLQQLICLCNSWFVSANSWFVCATANLYLQLLICFCNNWFVPSPVDMSLKLLFCLYNSWFVSATADLPSLSVSATGDIPQQQLICLCNLLSVSFFSATADWSLQTANLYSVTGDSPLQQLLCLCNLLSVS